MSRMSSAFDGLGAYWTNLSDRERLFLGILGVVAGALAVLLPVYLLSTAIGSLEDDNEEITAALRQIAHARGQLSAQQAERAAADQRYSRHAPTLGSFLEAKAGEAHLTVSDVQHEPEREEGGFRIRHSRARFQNTGLRPAIELLASIKNSRYPVTIERIHVDHHQAGDHYNFQVGVLAFDRQGNDADAGVPAADETSATTDGRRTAGPPAP